jgi:hypothetical protein
VALPDVPVPAGRQSCLVPPDHARLAIVFDLSADPIAGVVHRDDAGQGEPFAGWMELTRAIERGLAAARRAAAAAGVADADT